MKIIVSTFNNSKNNYGALFQACGLSSFLQKMNYDVSYVTIEKRKSKKENVVNIIKENLKKIILLPHQKKFKVRERKFKNFAKSTQKQIIYKNIEELYLNPPLGDVYLSGSDQVWNPVAMHEDLFLTYVPKFKRKISYAASMGNEIIPDNNRNKFIKFISEYDVISVREDTVVHNIKTIVNKNVYQNIDPVFLKSKEEWHYLEKRYTKIKFLDFIFVYAIEWNADFNKKLNELKKQTKLPIVSINIGNIKKICADQVIYDASPEEYLYLLNKCKFVVATSFHGIAMAIIYNKPFLALAGKNMPTRVQSLMRHFKIDVSMSLKYTSTDFDRINKAILEDQKIAKSYLQTAIEN